MRDPDVPPFAPTPLPELAPLPGQADVALAQVHRRRRRSALSLGSSAVAAALLLTLTNGVGTEGTAGVEPTAPGGQETATAVPTRRGHGGETHRPTGPRLATATTSPRLASPTAAPAPEPAGPVTTVTPDMRVEAMPEHRPRTPIVRTTRSFNTEDCYACSSRVELRRERGGIGFERSVGKVAGGQWSFPTEQELEVVLRSSADSDEVLWRWGDGQSFRPRRHDVVTQPGDAVSWDGWWDLVLDDGRRLPEGDYVLELILTTDEPDLRTAEFSVDKNGNPYFGPPSG